MQEREPLALPLALPEQGELQARQALVLVAPLQEQVAVAPAQEQEPLQEQELAQVLEQVEQLREPPLQARREQLVLLRPELELAQKQLEPEAWRAACELLLQPLLSRPYQPLPLLQLPPLLRLALESFCEPFPQRPPGWNWSAFSFRLHQIQGEGR